MNKHHAPLEKELIWNMLVFKREQVNADFGAQMPLILINEKIYSHEIHILTPRTECRKGSTLKCTVRFDNFWDICFILKASTGRGGAREAGPWECRDCFRSVQGLPNDPAGEEDCKHPQRSHP